MEDQLQRIPNMAKGETYRLGFSFLLHVNAKTKFCIGWRVREWKAAMIVISTIIVIEGGAILGRTVGARGRRPTPNASRRQYSVNSLAPSSLARRASNLP